MTTGGIAGERGGKIQLCIDPRSKNAIRCAGERERTLISSSRKEGHSLKSEKGGGS